jgi:DNA-directed RNA polymerase specialized sigma subunit
MNYIREAIEQLEEYNRLRCSLANLKEEIQDIKSTMPDAKAIVIDDMPHGSGPSSPDFEIVNKLYMIQKKTEEYKHTDRAIRRINRILESISNEKGCEQYGKLLKLWFIDKWDKIDIATELECTERHVYRLKGQAIRKFAIELNGIDVIV